jgi:hypothetical protein
VIRLAWDGDRTTSDVSAYKGLALVSLVQALNKPAPGFLVPAGALDANLALLLLEARQKVFVVPPVRKECSAAERLMWLGQPDNINPQFQLRDCDLPSYRLAVAQLNRDILPSTVAEAHLAWPFLAFTAVNLPFARELLAVMGDWRWYWHDRHPGRLTKYFAYMGLFPNIVERILANPDKRPVRPIEQRCHLVLKTWFNGYSASPNAELCHCFQGNKTPKDMGKVIHQRSRFLFGAMLRYWESSRSHLTELGFAPWRVFSELGVHRFTAYLASRTMT